LLLDGDSAARLDLLTVREAAELLRVRPVTIYGLCSAGKLPHLRVSNAIRISRRELEGWLRGHDPRPTGGA
jgi:excisionase family DNA binding protein